MLSSSSFYQVQDKFRTQSTFFEIKFELRSFCVSSSSSAKNVEFKFEFAAQVKHVIYGQIAKSNILLTIFVHHMITTKIILRLTREK